MLFAFGGLNQVLKAQNIAAGDFHSIFLCSNSSTQAVGLNSTGQLGDGTTVDKSTPISVSSLTGISAVAAGSSYSLYLKTDGTVWAVGNNAFGQLGDGTTVNKSTPVQVSSLKGIIAIEGGLNHSLFLKNDGTVWAVGGNGLGQIGDGTMANTTTPVQVSSLTGITAIAAGYFYSLFLKNDGTVWAVGYNSYGQLGIGTTELYKTTPVQVSSLTGIIAIAAGDKHSLFLKNNGTVWAAGSNGAGQLGDGSLLSKIIPVQVSSLTGITKVAAGDNHSLFVKSDGTVWAVGANIYGQLGDGTAGGYKTTPVQVTSLTGITKVAGGNGHSLFVKNDGTVWATGWNFYGGLGDGTTVDKKTPVQVMGLCNVSLKVVAQNAKEYAVDIYPNPSSGIFNIKIDDYLIGAKASIYNLVGRKIKDITLKSSTTAEILNKGVYLLEIEKDGNKTTKKLTIQ